MPLYTYTCPNHGEFDRIYTVSEMPESVPCPTCNSTSKKIITLGHGGIWRKDTAWIRDEVSPMFEMDGERPMETVEDYRDFLQRNPTIKPKESHPALPSSAGDCPRPKDEATRLKDMSKQAMEYVRKDNTLIVNSRTSAEATPV